ncbi:hypothetical protein ACFVYD_24595 [Streptomyces sp. NPDC058301]|uniref:hypothetical protein n=1 Tax=Streptomyces sp. NPDC058301 TaxID=3346436 RepID=UPI0036E0159D
MTNIDRTSHDARRHRQPLAWLTTLTALASTLAVVILALSHHTQAANAVATIGATMTALRGQLEPTGKRARSTTPSATPRSPARRA